MTLAAVTGAFVPRWAKKARLKHDRHQNQHVILYPERGLALNESAAAIALQIDGVRSVDAIVEALAAAHGAPPNELKADVIAFLSGLLEKGLLENHRAESDRLESDREKG